MQRSQLLYQFDLLRPRDRSDNASEYARCFGGEAMHIVELRYSEDAVAKIIRTMRRWLDGGKAQPATVRYSLHGTTTVLHVDFELEAEALAFARAFGGVVLP